MARTQARVLVSIWNDEDFRRLPRRAQGTYMFLLSQANLNHAGLLPLTVKRWAMTAGGCTVEEVEEDLAQLEAADYVVIDRATEELLIRTLIRNDGIWKQPKVMQAMKADSGEIASPLLRYRLRCELLKIDVTLLEKEETRTVIAGVIADVVATLPDTPPQGYEIPLETPTVYPHAGAGAPSSASTTATTSATATSTGLATREPPPDDPVSRLLVDHVNAYTEPPPLSAQAKVKTEIMRLVAEGVPEHRICAGLSRLREKRVAVSLLPQLVAECATVARPSTTDQRTAAGLALVDKYREAEGA